MRLIFGFYSDAALDTESILPHVLSSETGMPLSRLLGLKKGKKGLFVQVRWKVLPHEEDTLEPIVKVYEDVPAMLKKLLDRKSTKPSLVTEAKSVLGLS